MKIQIADVPYLAKRAIYIGQQYGYDWHIVDVCEEPYYWSAYPNSIIGHISAWPKEAARELALLDAAEIPVWFTFISYTMACPTRQFPPWGMKIVWQDMAMIGRKLLVRLLALHLALTGRALLPGLRPSFEPVIYALIPFPDQKRRFVYLEIGRIATPHCFAFYALPLGARMAASMMNIVGRLYLRAVQKLPKMVDKLTVAWLGRAVVAGSPRSFDGGLIFLFRVIAYSAIGLGWLLLAHLTVLLSAALFTFLHTGQFPAFW